MNYKETLEYLYARLPMFQSVGKIAFKKDLSNTIKFLAALNNPHQKFKSIHIAGTNGKGTSAHSIASVLQAAGYKTGLYTSPHLKSFTERIRINGIEIPQLFVVDFIAQNQDFIEQVKPSFFETTVAMAFDYFAKQQVDIAVIEVGLGGRLDSTNVIDPLISLITMIGMDHQDMLGETLPQIAAEKAGIIKAGKPVIIGADQPDIRDVFINKALSVAAPITFANDHWYVEQQDDQSLACLHHGKLAYRFNPDVKGKYYIKNLAGVLATLYKLKEIGIEVSNHAIEEGLRQVITKTGLKGRWQVLGSKPTIICDVGHNEDGIRENMNQLNHYQFNKLYFILGGVADKRWDRIFPLLPKDAYYIITQPQLPRAMNASALHEMMKKAEGFDGRVEVQVNDAIKEAKSMAGTNDLIFIGGSTFVVAEIEGL